MHVHKSADTMLLLGYTSRGGQTSLVVTVGYCCGLDGARVSEQQAWKTLTGIFTDEPFDLTLKKWRSGFGVAGSAIAPHNRPVTGLTVSAGVGELQKSILVIGDRQWTRAATGWQSSAPQLFAEMPIGLARAFGAKGFASNPHGRGKALTPEDPTGTLLPNVEAPYSPVLRPADTPEPAGLGLLAQGDPRQTRWLGRLDVRWQRERLPWLPDDTDPRWFDRFPQDQCRDSYWKGDESWFAENMNADQPSLRGRLPGLRPRLLARCIAGPDARFELPLDLDTVWLLPNTKQLLILYRAELATQREDAEDVLGLAVFTEKMNEPAGAPAHWAAIWKNSQEEALQPAPVVPPEMTPEVAEQAVATLKEAESYAQAALAHRAAVTKALADARASALAQAEQSMRHYGMGTLQGRTPKDGLLVDASSQPPPLAWPAEPAAFKAEVTKYVTTSLAEGENQARNQWKNLGQDFDSARARARARPAAVPDPVRAIMNSSLAPERKAEVMQRFKTFDAKIAALQGQAADLSARARVMQANTQAPVQPPQLDVLPLPDEALPQGPRTPLDRQALLARRQQGKSAQWTLLQDLDLAGQDLSGMDFTGSLLNACNLQGADLSHADFTDCQFDDCTFEHVRASHAHFTRARFNACRAASASLTETDFQQAYLRACTFQNADLRASIWKAAKLTACDFSKANFDDAQCLQISLTDCLLPGVHALNAAFIRATFSKCVLADATFDASDLTGATLLGCEAMRARFVGANLKGLRTLKGTDLRQANLSRAQLEKASMQDTNLSQASLRESCLSHGFLKNCDLTGTDAWHLQARRADFTGSCIVRASWRGANLMQARMNQVVLQDVDLTGANLHAAETRTARVQGLKLEQALLTRCRLLQEYARD